MEENKPLGSAAPGEPWQKFEITWQESPKNYRAIVHTGKHQVQLEIVGSVGGGEEGWGWEQTTLTAPLPPGNTFKFAITPEDFLNRIGKFFGLQDVQIGYPEFDESVLVQTNDEQRLKALFSDGFMREIFQNLSGYSFHIEKADEGGDQLQLLIQRAILEPTELQRVFKVFNFVLNSLS